MKMSNNIFFNEEAQHALKSGVKKICDAVTITMGPRGKLVLIEKKGEPPHLTKDGATVAKSIVLEDRVEDLGAKLLKQASENTATVAGDGSTTSTLLAKELYFNASQALQTGIGSPSEIVDLLNRKVDSVIDILKDKSQKVASNEEIKQVATISANGDDYIGSLIADAMKEVGTSGLVTVEKSKTTNTELKLVKGVKVDRGYISPYFITDTEKSKAVLEDPLILILSCKLNSLTQILPILEKVHQTSKPLFIIANDYEQEAIQALLANVSKGLLQICAVRSPFYGEKRAVILQDLAKALNTKVFYDLEEKDISNVVLSDLGTCKKVETTHDTTLFVECEPEGEIEDITKDITSKLDDKTISKEEEAFYKQRLIINKGVVAVLSIGAHTESELLELVDRIDDALHATKAAVESGFLPGGGTALARVGLMLMEQSSAESSLLENTVEKIVADACMSPLRQILRNADLSVDYIFEMIKQKNDFNHGFDVRNEKYTDMVESGIIDPQKVTATAIKNAASVCNSLLSIGCIVLSNENYDQGVQLVQLSDDMY
ncbi:MAG: chaperonin GroEL [Flavobacteriia bacterium]|nr:chaperonin GroEL [Flavobacteriia bacterium]